MSEELLKGFLEKIKGDTSLQEQLKAEGAALLLLQRLLVLQSSNRIFGAQIFQTKN